MFEILGVIGIAISVLAYLPQVVHLAREHCSAGVSGRAWAMWLASSLLVGALALHRHDPVFILLQLSTLAAATVILFLVHRYRGMVCATHTRVYGRSRGDANDDAAEAEPWSTYGADRSRRRPTSRKATTPLSSAQGRRGHP